MKAECPIGAMSLQFAAKKLAERGVDTGGHKIFKQLRSLGMLNGIHPSMHAVHMGWLDEEAGHWERGGMDRDYCRVFITPSGLNEAEHRLKKITRATDRPPVVISSIDLGVDNKVALGF